MENNPYTILGVSPAASKAEITKAVAVAMKRKQYPVDANTSRLRLELDKMISVPEIVLEQMQLSRI